MADLKFLMTLIVFFNGDPRPYLRFKVETSAHPMVSCQCRLIDQNNNRFRCCFKTRIDHLIINLRNNKLHQCIWVPE